MFRPVAKITNGVAADYGDQSALKKTVIAFIKLRYILLFALVLILGCAGTFFAGRNDSAASAVMSLNYEESAKGLSPNSTRFNIYELKSPEVVEKMLYYCGIDAHSVDVDKIVDSISVNPTNSKGFTVDDYYIATSYAITIKKPAGVKDVSTQDLLTFLCKAYTDVFYARYADNRSILSFDIGEFDGLEFLHVADLMRLKVQQQSKYLNTRVKENKTFTDGVSEETFKSLAIRLEDFETYDIERYRSYVLQTGISHDKAHFIRVLNYVNFINSLQFDKNMASFDSSYDGVTMYNDAMTSVVMIPTIDRSRGNYYMSKTKTGMDYMTSQADAALAAAQGIAQKIETNSDVIAKLQAGANRRADVDAAHRMIEDMQVKFGEIGKQIEALDKAYIKYKTKDYITFQIKGMSLTQRLRVDLLLYLAVAFTGGAFAALWINFRYFGKGVKR
ncbi:MAG: hypothetical protein IJS44_02545 [Clostridia bacterium]|nr:hypothetical protein [Clostridia bacterium]